MSQKIGDFQEDNFEQKLLGLKDTQESIQSLSAWCLKYQQQHKKVVGCWLHVLRKVKVEQRVTLFYLANDVIQYSKRRSFPFVESWATALQKATPLVRDDKVKHKILRLFKIWGERNIYDETFLSDLSGLLTLHTKKNTVSTADLIQDFQPSLLFAKIRRCKVLEEDTDLKLKLVKQSTIPVYDDIDAVQVAVKDRQNCDDFLLDVDDGILRLEAYTKALELEIKERIEVINVLEVSEQFYDTQKGEAKVVCNAYRNFGSRIKALKRKLEELLPTLPSPVPSPDINAPSPSSGSDIEIPDHRKEPVRYDSEVSFIGTDFVTAMNAANEKQSEYVRQMHQQQTNYQSHDQGAHLQFDTQNPPSSFDNYMPKDALNSTRGFYQGNVIEVVNSSQTSDRNFTSNDDGRSFLQNVITNPPPTHIDPSQSKIPGLGSPSENTSDLFNFIDSKMKADKDVTSLPWIEKPVTKYQSWPSPDLTWNNSQETPVSPPAFEQESYSNPVEYVDTNVDTRFPSPYRDSQSQSDVDHRIFNAPPKNLHSGLDYNQMNSLSLPKQDVDNRCAPMNRNNLIALTNSPSINDSWKPSDSDYRTIPMPPTPPIALGTPDHGGRISKPPIDNIESVDMEMSDDEEGKHEDRNRPRRASIKDDDGNDQKNDHRSQLLPPPIPWDIISRMDNEDDANDIRKNDPSFHKLPPPTFLGNMGAMEPPRLPIPPIPDFSRFPTPNMGPGPLAPPPVLPAPNGTLNPMNFPRPPMMNMSHPQDARMFTPRMDFQSGPPVGAPNYGQPFNNFMAYGEPRNRPPFPQPSSQMSGNAHMNQSPMKNSFQRSYSDDRKRSYDNANSGSRFPPKDNDMSYSATSKDDTYRRNSVSNIEPIVKNRQFDKRIPDSAPSFENSGPNQSKPVTPRSNLKEISLSDVLEKSMLQSQRKESDSQDTETTANQSAVDNDDLFGEETTGNDNAADDGDDLYNNIEETTTQSAEISATFNTHQSTPKSQQNISVHASGDNKMRQKTPFQGTVPKVARLPMTPAITIEDDERNPWPIMPVIDLSEENNGYGAGDSSMGRNQEDETANQGYGTPFPRRGNAFGRFQRGGPRFSNSGDRNFMGGQSPSPRRGRYPSPRNEFRQRGSPGMFGFSSPDHMRGTMRPSFNRTPDMGPRPNFQNSPRMFSQRPQRMFRRGW